MLVEVTSMIASVGSSIFGSGTVSTRTSRFPCHMTACMSLPRLRSWVAVFVLMKTQPSALAGGDDAVSAEMPHARSTKHVRTERIGSAGVVALVEVLDQAGTGRPPAELGLGDGARRGAVECEK